MDGCGLSHLADKGGAIVTPDDYPPVALERLDDRSGWRWLSPRPVGAVDWILTVTLCVLALPVLLVFGPIVLVLRTIDRT